MVKVTWSSVLVCWVVSSPAKTSSHIGEFARRRVCMWANLTVFHLCSEMVKLMSTC